MFVSKVRRVGNSQSVIVPATIARTLGIEEGDEVEVEVRPIGHVPFETALEDCFNDYDDVLEALSNR